MTKPTKIVLSLIAGVALIASLPILGGIVLGGMMVVGELISDLRYSATQVKPTEDEIVGTYTAQLGWGSAKLTLDPDHQFEESVADSRQEPAKQQGTWKSEKGEFGTEVTFSPFVEVGEEKHGTSYPNYALKFSRLKNGPPFAELDGALFTKQSR